MTIEGRPRVHVFNLKQLSSGINLKTTSYKYFKISLQIYIISVSNKRNLHIFTCLLRKRTIRFSAIGIFLLYITATALVTSGGSFPFGKSGDSPFYNPDREKKSKSFPFGK